MYKAEGYGADLVSVGGLERMNMVITRLCISRVSQEEALDPV